MANTSLQGAMMARWSLGPVHYFYVTSRLESRPTCVCVQVKVWNATSGLCFVTFSEHSSSVSNVTFTSSGFVIISASLDGTVRAFDLHR